jgi:hypothetical protein
VRFFTVASAAMVSLAWQFDQQQIFSVQVLLHFVASVLISLQFANSMQQQSITGSFFGAVVLFSVTFFCLPLLSTVIAKSSSRYFFVTLLLEEFFY